MAERFEPCKNHRKDVEEVIGILRAVEEQGYDHLDGEVLSTLQYLLSKTRETVALEAKSLAERTRRRAWLEEVFVNLDSLLDALSRLSKSQLPERAIEHTVVEAERYLELLADHDCSARSALVATVHRRIASSDHDLAFKAYEFLHQMELDLDQLKDYADQLEWMSGDLDAAYDMVRTDPALAETDGAYAQEDKANAMESIAMAVRDLEQAIRKEHRLLALNNTLLSYSNGNYVPVGKV